MSFRVTFGSLTGDITAAHFHNATAGVLGPPVRDILGDLTGNTFEGVWRATDADSLTPALVMALLASEIYVNLHTTAFPTGEIRGQLLQNTTGTPFDAALDGSQLVPPLAGVGSGTGTFVLSSDGTALAFSISFGGLTGLPNAAHFHNAASGANGDPVRSILKNLTRNTFSGTWSSTDSDPLTPSLVQELKNGNIYINIHTPINTGGEIRGQVMPAQ